MLQITHFLIRAIAIRVTWWVEGEIEKLLVFLHIGFPVVRLNLERVQLVQLVAEAAIR